MSSPTVAEWLSRGVGRWGDRAAFSGVDDAGFLSHAELGRSVEASARQLRSWGIGRQDIVLIALPDSPKAVTAVLAVASVGGALPVAAQEQPDEYARILDEVPIAMILMEERPSSPLTKLAADRDIPLATVSDRPGAHPAELGLECVRPRPPSTEGPSTPDDAALCILTSGTTAAPKIVALTHASLWRQLASTREMFGLTELDRSLVLMPITHLHGIARASLSVLAAGGAITVAPGLDSRRVLDWLDRFSPTFITAAPAAHRRLLQAWKTADRKPQNRSLRLLGVASDRIEPDEVADMRAAFDVQVVQFYGMTETAPQIAATPLHGPVQPEGSVGRIDAHWSVTCLDEAGRPVDQGQSGEIAVVGGTINRLVGRSLADSQRFDADGRFLTGDIGRVDADGFLFVEGRIDGVINRGGQKINPTVVEAAVASHPAVRAVLAFPEPDPVLGSRVAVAVEINDGASITSDELLEHAEHGLRRYMVPERLHFTDALPRNRMGKLSRAAVTSMAFTPIPPTTRAREATASSTTDATIFAAVLEIFGRQLQRDDIDPDSSFFRLGGDSLGSMNVLIEVEERYGVTVPPATFERISTARALAEYLAGQVHRRRPEQEPTGARLVHVRDGHEQPPLVFAHGLGGSDFLGPLFSRLDLVPGRPLLSLESAGSSLLDHGPRDLAAITREYATLIAERGEGSHMVAGHSMGAHVAFATAANLVANGSEVDLVVVFDDDAGLTARAFGIENEPLTVRSMGGFFRRAMDLTPVAPMPLRVLLVRAEEDDAYYRSDSTGGWGEVALGGVKVVSVPGNHHSLVRQGAIEKAAESLIVEVGVLDSNGPVVANERDPQRQLRYEARLACVGGDQAGEVSRYREAIAFDADQPSWVYENLGSALLQAGDDQAGHAMLDEAIARDPWPLSIDPGVDPVRWTPESWGDQPRERESTCHEEEHGIRPSSALKPSASLASQATRCARSPRTSASPTNRSDAGSSRPMSMPVKPRGLRPMSEPS